MKPTSIPGPSTISRVWIEEGCIVCRECERACPAVFAVPGEGCVVRPGAPLARAGEGIRRAAALCPVEVIRYETGLAVGAGQRGSGGGEVSDDEPSAPGRKSARRGGLTPRPRPRRSRATQ